MKRMIMIKSSSKSAYTMGKIRAYFSLFLLGVVEQK